jgi:hypothetical protein
MTSFDRLCKVLAGLIECGQRITYLLAYRRPAQQNLRMICTDVPVSSDRLQTTTYPHHREHDAAKHDAWQETKRHLNLDFGM